MADVKQKITIQSIADVSSVLKSIETIKKSLDKLEIRPETRASFDNLFSKMEKQAERASDAFASGFKRKGDVEKYTDALDQISSGYDRIVSKIDILKTKKITLNGNFSKLEEAEKELKQLKKELESFKGAVEPAMTQAMNGLNVSVAGHKGKGWQAVLDSFKNGVIDVQALEKAIKDLNDQYEKGIKAKGSSGPNSEYWQDFKRDLDSVQQNLNNYNAAVENVTNAETLLSQKQQEVDAYLNEGTKALTEADKAAREAAVSSKEYANSAEKAAKETQQLHSELENFKNKAAYFFGLSNAINLFKRSLRSAYDTVKDLDAVMTETAVVTNFDVGDMWKQLPEYTQRANELGVSIHSAYEAATIFYQQGLKTNEVMAVSNETLKMARIAGLDAATASDRMTNALRGFNMEMDKVSAQRVNDVYSKLAAITASNTDEISTAMTKVASLAHNANMEFETTSAFLAQMIETTRESAETAGTALKTVVARFSEVKKLYSKGELLGQDEEGGEIDVNKVSTALRSAGINLNEYLTGTKGLDDIFIELASKWDSLDKVQQRYIATMAAGSRQQSRFIAMMSDYKRTMELVDAANNANGASQEQYAKTLESLQTKLSRLKNAWDEFILGLANSDVIKGAVDRLTDLITVINTLIKGVSKKNAGIKMVTTFFTAFAGFKIGQKMFGKTTLGKFFGGLIKTGEGESAKGATAIAKTFYVNLSDSIAKYQKRGGIIEIFKETGTNIFGNIQHYFDPNAILKSNLDKNAIGGDWKNLTKTLSQSGLTLDQLNAALKANGQDLIITTENAKEYGIVLDENNTVVGNNLGSIRALSAVLGALGGIMMIFGNQLEKMEGPAKKWGTVIKGLGAGLMTFGTIMSVWLPLQAQIMATGVTTAIDSIPIVGWIAALISAIAALGVAFYNFEKNNSLEAKLKSTQEAARNAAQAADDAKDVYEKLNEAWKNLDDKNIAIEEATKGTQEWRDAIKEVNDAVLELMNSYDGIIEIERGENGALIIKNRKTIDAMMKSDSLTSEGAVRASKIKVHENEETKRRHEYFTGNYKAGATMRSGTYLPAAQVVNDYEDNLDELQSKSNDEIKELLRQTKRYKQNQDPVNKAAWGEYDLDKGVKEIRNYIKDTENSKRAIQSERTAFGATILRNAEIDEEFQPYANAFISDDYVNNLLKKNEKTYEEDSKSDLQRKYAEAHNTTWEKMVENNPDLKDYSDIQLREYLATRDALKESKIQITAFTNSLAKLEPEQRALFTGPNGEGLTQDLLNTFKGYDEKKKEQLYTDYGGKDAFGTYEAFENLFNKIIQGATDNFDTSKFAQHFTNEIDKGLTGNLDSGTYKKFIDNLWSVYSASGKEGVDTIQDSIKNMAKEANMSSKDLKNFIKSIDSIDWSSTNSIRTLSDLAKEYGISEDKANELEEQIIKLNNAATKVDLKKVTEQIKSLTGLAKKLQIGTQDRNFSEEQKNQLIEAGVSKDKFVYNIETGQYNYTGVLSEISNKITQLINNTFDKNQIEKDIASGEAANEAFSKGNENAQDKTEIIQAYRSLAKENSKISSDAFMDAWRKVQYGDYTDMDKLYAIIKADADSYEDNKQKLNDYIFEKEVMQRQLNPGLANATRANQGDEASVKALQAQISSSGLSKEFEQKYLSGISNGDNAAIRQAGNIVDTFDQARANGISAEDLNAYADALQRVQGLEKKQTDELYAMALAEAKYQEGMKSLVSTYNQWSKFIDKNGNFKIPQPDTADFKVYEKMKEDLAKMLNSSEKIPDKFFEAGKNAELLQRAVKQDKKAVAELAAKLAKMNIGSLGSDKLDTEVDGYLNKIQKELPDLKIGATFDDKDAEVKLAQLLSNSGKTVEEVNKIMGNMGMSMQWEPEVVDLKSYAAEHRGGYITVPDENSPTGTKTVPVDNYSTSDGSSQVTILKPKKATFTKPPKINPPKTTRKSGGKKGGGGGKKAKKKKERWENPYDELYNLQEKINEALRKREALERRYQKLLKQQQTSLKDIRAAYYDQIKQMRTEASLQRELAAGRLRQIENIGKETYVKSNGKVTTFEKMGVLKYASWDKNTGELQIDWDAIQKLEGTKHVETGKAVEAYVSKLEELTKSYEETRNTLWDIEDKIEDLRQEVIDSYMSFEERVMEAVVNRYQKQIDNYQAMSDAIDKVNNEVLKSLREQVDLSRQIRDNTKKEEDISKKENRLAYLRRDTSGANDLEILSLEKELKEAREGYSDDLVDQAIDKMQDDADKASEQRTRQIETMQEQLDIAKETGALWKEVWGLMNEAAAGDGALSPYSNLVNLLKETEAFQSLSEIGKSDWFQKVTEEYLKAQTGKNEAEDKFKVDANGDGVVKNTNTQNTINEVAGETKTYKKLTPRELSGITLAAAVGGYGWSKESKQLNTQLKGKNILPAQITTIIKKVNELIRVSAGQLKNNNWRYLSIAKNNKITDLKPYTMSKFKTGGLADKTGPAWLDGTKTNPELVLNSQDTRNFIALKDILASLMNTQKTGNKTSTGNNYFDIDIHADIGSDYDVDKLANRLKKIIFEDGQYRNVNTINLLR